MNNIENKIQELVNQVAVAKAKLPAVQAAYDEAEGKYFAAWYPTVSRRFCLFRGRKQAKADRLYRPGYTQALEALNSLEREVEDTERYIEYLEDILAQGY